MRLFFSTPRKLPVAADLPGRVVVLDIAFAADGMGTPFAEVTGRFLEELGGRLAAWVDHHDHELQARYRGDERFVLATKAEHGGCPEMITPELVARVGPVDSVVTHADLDGLYAAAKWMRGGREPYPGADADARAIDTRTGAPTPTAVTIDEALRARFRDETLKHRVVRWLVGGLTDAALGEEIAAAAAAFAETAAETARLAAAYEVDRAVAYVDARRARGPFDKTELLLRGQALAPVAIVHDNGNIAVAAAFDSGWDFVSLLGLGGGMPTRVSLAEARLAEVRAAVQRAARDRSR